ncbi:MAG TPA: Na+/H+ antiporter NhaA [Hyphomicrobiaceae bacterium]|nr:Na+/H+ antiporter NhaA [Hyphomicrobiaceae bacterium]
MTQQRRASALDFIQHEAAGGIALVVAAIAALLIANSPLASDYKALQEIPAGVRIGAIGLQKTLLHWVNDGLMAIFFFLVGLEIKREFLVGELSDRQSAALPLFGALGGMIVPAVIYAMMTYRDSSMLSGWAIPCATDIAFAVGVLALLGKRIPPALKLFLLALAIIDDLGAIIIIALFYTADLSAMALVLAAFGIFGLVILNVAGVARLGAYVLLGAFVWICVLKSGVHATLAGVATALALPLGVASREEDGLDGHAGGLQADLHPWVTFAILPLFAFFNAGVSLSGIGVDQVASGITLGIALGLFVGKPIGIVLFTALAIRTGLARLPDGVSWRHMVGCGVLCGIGFTMSLFIGTLAFPDGSREVEVRLGVLLGSLVSAVVGGLMLWRCGRNTEEFEQS